MGPDMPTGKPSGRGYAYVMLLISLAVLSSAAAASLSFGAAWSRRDAELQLLAIGSEFESALLGYANVPLGAVAPAGGQGPKELLDLLRDPRAPGLRRHLRQIYADPLTGKTDWGVDRDVHGYIVGVHSIATGKPIKQTGFPTHQQHFNEASTYAKWVFGLSPQQPREVAPQAIPQGR